MKILVDAFGGDNAPEEIVKGCVLAVNEKSDLIVVLVGKKQEIELQLSKYSFNKNQIEIIEANDVVLNEDHPVSAIRNKPDSSLVVAFNNLKENDEFSALVSAGNSGAVLAGAQIKLGKIKGVQRPTLMTTFPTITGGTVLLADAGVNMDCKPEYLAQFALMANLYATKIQKKQNPTVGLLNVGVEEYKGDELTKQAHALLSTLPINFLGNMESRDYISGKWDIIVADGFAGNVLNKGTEGAVLNFLKMFKAHVQSSFKAKIGYLLMKKQLKKMLKVVDFNEHGGALFMGVNKIVIKCHGASKARSIKLAIFEAYDAAASGIIDILKKEAEGFSEIKVND